MAGIDYADMVSATIASVKYRVEFKHAKISEKNTVTGYLTAYSLAYRSAYPGAPSIAFNDKDRSVVKQFLKRAPNFNHAAFIAYCLESWEYLATKSNFPTYKNLPKVPSLAFILSSSVFPVLYERWQSGVTAAAYGGAITTPAPTPADDPKQASTDSLQVRYDKLRLTYTRLKQSYASDVEYWKNRACTAEALLREGGQKLSDNSVAENALQPAMFNGRILPTWESD